MRVAGAIAAATAALVAAAGFTPPAHASNYGLELNGKYLVTSNGDWAKTNEVYHNEQTVRQVWTTTSSCASPTRCTGHIVSSEGWEADGKYTEDRWVIRRTIPDWQPCYDGSTSPGNQEFRFWPVDSNGQRYPSDGSLFGGVDVTKGPSGGCGRNYPLVIELPLRLQRIT